jgi:hypothetical protein
MNSETKNCANCKNQFVIDAGDFDFYKKINVPAPTWCPQCRMVRRLAFFNVWNLYKRTCAKCAKSTLSIYSPDKPNIIYCLACWWGDDWDGTEYAMDYDPSKPFLEQVKELAAKTPWQARDVDHLTVTNSEYINAAAHIKNSYLIFWADYCENAFYSSYLDTLKDSLDCYRIEKSELSYEVVGGDKCYRTFFSEECDACNEVWFSRACAGCTNCFGCINLRNKNYCIFNQQYSKEEYFSKLKEFHLDSRAALAEMKTQVYEFWNKHPRRAYIGNSLNVNVSGDYIFESRNTSDAYMVTGAENSRYVQFLSLGPTRDCYDYTGWGNGAEQLYESSVVGEGVSKVKFSHECWPNILDAEYCICATASKHILGCVNLKRKEYCILNKQYAKEEFEKLSAQIKEEMTKNPYKDSVGRSWTYGEFLPVDFSNFAYNESVALQFFPKTKEEALAEGYQWYEGNSSEYTITKNGNDVPDTIAEVNDAILKEVIGCIECRKAFRFTPGELGLMQKLNLPLPSKCPSCRQQARFARTNLPKLYDRTCAKCGKDIKTSYAPDRPEIVYCEACYQQEIL